MSMLKHLLICCTLTTNILTSAAVKRSIGERLIKHLLANTSTVVRPKINRTEPTTVWLDLDLIQITRLEETTQCLEAKYWVRHSWYNEFMTWNSTQWKGITHAQVHSNLVWTPDIVLYNNAESSFSGGRHKFTTKISMYPDGLHVWKSPVTFYSVCKIHVVHFPFDGQTCFLKFGSWTFDNRFIRLRPVDKPVITESYIPSSEWEVIEAGHKHHSEGYGHEEEYDDVTYIIRMSRVETSYLFYMITPCIMLVLTTLFSFSLPADSGERIVVIVTNLLAFALFMNSTNEVLPTNSDSITTISVFYLVLMLESAASLCMACCVLTVYHRGREPNPPEIPGWLKTVFMKIYLNVYRLDMSRISTTLGSKMVKEFRLKGFSSDGGTMKVGDTPKAIKKMSGNLEMNSTIPAKIFSPKFEKKILHLLADQYNRNSKSTRVKSLPADILLNTSMNADSVLPASEGGELNAMEGAMREISSELQVITRMKEQKTRRDALRLDWELIGTMLDRMYFWVFLLVVSLSSTILWKAYKAKEAFERERTYLPSVHHDD